MKGLEIVKLKREIEERMEEEKNLNILILQKDQELANMNKEVDKTTKQKNKVEKEHKNAVNEQKEELLKCFSKIDKYVAENTILLEEIKTLKKLREVKEKLCEASIEKMLTKLLRIRKKQIIDNVLIHFGFGF